MKRIIILMIAMLFLVGCQYQNKEICFDHEGINLTQTGYGYRIEEGTIKFKIGECGKPETFEEQQIRIADLVNMEKELR